MAEKAKGKKEPAPASTPEKAPAKGAPKPAEKTIEKPEEKPVEKPVEKAKGKPAKVRKREKGAFTRYKVEATGLTRLRPWCERCGPGYFMADHGNRFACGHCGFTRYKRA
jgi:small subunit ribosomal protein S27Ae